MRTMYAAYVHHLLLPPTFAFSLFTHYERGAANTSASATLPPSGCDERGPAVMHSVSASSGECVSLLGQDFPCPELSADEGRVFLSQHACHVRGRQAVDACRKLPRCVGVVAGATATLKAEHVFLPEVPAATPTPQPEPAPPASHPNLASVSPTNRQSAIAPHSTHPLCFSLDAPVPVWLRLGLVRAARLPRVHARVPRCRLRRALHPLARHCARRRAACGSRKCARQRRELLAAWRGGGASRSAR